MSKDIWKMDENEMICDRHGIVMVREMGKDDFERIARTMIESENEGMRMLRERGVVWDLGFIMNSCMM